jgi:hypothetical protein
MRAEPLLRAGIQKAEPKTINIIVMDLYEL